MSRTLGKAAELLNVTQSTISYNLSELESEMGMVLVDRQKGMKSIRLTPAGEGFLPLALKWQEISREICNARNPGSAYSLSLGASVYIICRIMPPYFRAMLSHEPPVYLRVSTEEQETLYANVENRLLDIAVTTQESSMHNVQVEPFYKEGFVVARIPAPGEASDDMINICELRPEKEFYIEWSRGFRLWHEHVWDPAKPCYVKLDSEELASVLMNRPGDWCIIPESAEEKFSMEAPRAVFRRLYDSPPDIVYYKLTHKYPKASSVPGLAVFDDVVKESRESIEASAVS